ncbi:MAG TPA: hypothetical protein DEB39_13535 [Planctomycetaceae bacterium]|nr:hypothetical protein [Planctomycetaceae bacterium]
MTTLNHTTTPGIGADCLRQWEERILDEARRNRVGLLLTDDEKDLETLLASLSERWGEEAPACLWIDCSASDSRSLTERILEMTDMEEAGAGDGPDENPFAVRTEYGEAFHPADAARPPSFSLREPFDAPVSSVSHAVGSPTIPRGKQAFVSKAMAWLRLSDVLIAENRQPALPFLLLSGLGRADIETRREVFRLLRLYLTHRPNRTLLIAETAEDVSLIPPEYLDGIRLQLFIR